MRILVINYEFPPLGGGGGVASCEIAKGLVARGHEVDVLTTGRRGLASSEVADGIVIYRVPVVGRSDVATATIPSMVSFLPSSLWKGCQLLREKQYDVLNTHFAVPSGPTGVILARLFRKPQALTIIGGDIYDPTKKLSPSNNVLLRAVVRSVLNSSKHIIAISEDIRRRARTDYRCPRDIEVIPYGLSPIEFERKTRAELGVPEGDIVLISIGRLIKRKAFNDLLVALGRLEQPTLRLLIIGEGPEERDLRGLAETIGLSARIDFLGAIWGERKFQYLAASDIFVLPSLHEGFGLVFLEAMYCGLPVIASSSGGQTDFLREGETGFLVPVGDADTLAAAIERLVEDSALRQKVGEFNQQYVRRFSIAQVARQYEAVFSRLAGSANMGAEERTV